MPLTGDYEPGSLKWSADQADLIESTEGAQGTTIEGMPVVLLTTRGVKTGKLRKIPLMRVEYEGTYAVVASLGGAPKNPDWYHNVKAEPLVELRDGSLTQDMVAREVSGDEKSKWWDRAVAVYPDYAEYQKKTDRRIPVFVLEPA
ncbi:nitroreductase family deazaflavin-dependent oxidoreductase [Rhodococcus sp. NPDC049939]|uniref:nitroreductase family deazaflavin-dependent oxidoreductase n=1 Tax=Rhodococcus sp. NPDC049939 TaxID=3155511 RepID=UPI0033CF5744